MPWESQWHTGMEIDGVDWIYAHADERFVKRSVYLRVLRREYWLKTTLWGFRTSYDDEL